MAANEKLDCTIYVDTEMSIGDLAKLLADFQGGDWSGLTLSKTVKVPGCEIEVRKNPDNDPNGRADFPDGFLFFPYVLEFYPDPGIGREDNVSRVGKILSLLWSKGWPALAACDYEDELPCGGGYKNRSVPWVSQVPERDGLAKSTDNGTMPSVAKVVDEH